MLSIVANGQFPRTLYPRHLLESSDVIICCDGALSVLERHGIIPDVVIGDLDSVCARALSRFKGIVVKDGDQQTNDLTKAVKYVAKNFPDQRQIHIIAGTGRSEAHTVGNVSLLMEYAREYPQVEMDMVSDYSTIFALTDSETLHIGAGRRISIFSPDSSLRIKSSGLHWKTDDVIFDNWWKATLNRADEDTVKLEFNHKSLALIILD